MVNSQNTIESNPRTKPAAAHSLGPTDPHLVVAKITVGFGIRSRPADRTKNMTALMINDLGSIGPGAMSTLSRPNLTDLSRP